MSGRLVCAGQMPSCGHRSKCLSGPTLPADLGASLASAAPSGDRAPARPSRLPSPGRHPSPAQPGGCGAPISRGRGCAPTTGTSPHESRLADAQGPDVASQPPLRLGRGHVTRAPPIRGAGAAPAGMRRRAAALRSGGAGCSRRALASEERLRCFPIQSPEVRAGAARAGCASCAGDALRASPAPARPGGGPGAATGPEGRRGPGQRASLRHRALLSSPGLVPSRPSQPTRVVALRTEVPTAALGRTRCARRPGCREGRTPEPTCGSASGRSLRNGSSNVKSNASGCGVE